jgi:hypothetical protein
MSHRVSVSKSVQHESTEPSRRYGLRDGACQAITQGSGEQYLSAFALLLQASPFQLSLLSALPQLIGTVAQVASVKLLRWFPDRKALILAGTVGQAFAWIPILLLPLLFPDTGPWLVIAGTACTSPVRSSPPRPGTALLPTISINTSEELTSPGAPQSWRA